MSAVEPESWHRGDWMQTWTGRQFYPITPRPDDVDPRDIAHALSMLCRYNGHVDRFYSVAEHCILMSYAMPTAQLALEALLHDGTEAYVGDMIRPLKHQPELGAYRLAEDRVMVAIAERFGLPLHTIDDGGGAFPAYIMPRDVKLADTRILLTERNALMPISAGRWGADDLTPLDVPIHAWSPAVAEAEYLARLVELGVDLGDDPVLTERTKAYDRDAERERIAAAHAREGI